MNICVLMASPRKNGNTASMLAPIIKTLEDNNAATEIIWLYDKKIEPCIACRNCQNDYTKFGCVHNDDMQGIFDAIMQADIILLATPIYSWYCTAPMKAALDRLVYGMNKYYGKEKGPSLWKNKKCAILATCGYKPEKGADLFEEGIKRYCKHSQLQYIGMCAARDPGYTTAFISDEKIGMAKEFAFKILLSDKLRKITAEFLPPHGAEKPQE